MNDALIFTLSVIPMVGNSGWVASTDHTVQIHSGEHQASGYHLYWHTNYISGRNFFKNLFVTMHRGTARHEDHGCYYM